MSLRKKRLPARLIALIVAIAPLAPTAPLATGHAFAQTPAFGADSTAAAGTAAAPAPAANTLATGTLAENTLATGTLAADTLAAARFIRPPYLRTGDTVGIVSPAGRIPLKADTAQVRERFEAWGLHVKFGTHYADRRHPYFAGSDSQRAQDLQQMLDDPSVKAVIAYRGGYGSVRLLPMLRFEGLREHPKWLVGFSDITLLHLVLRRLGVESIHGAMPGTFVFDREDPSAESLRQALFGLSDSVAVAPHPLNCHGVASGRLAGGNLMQLCAALGTPEELDVEEPTVLFIEEIGEFAYRIDRMMQSLRRSGKLRNLRAVVVGHFTDMMGLERFGVKDPYEVIDPYLRPLGIPVVYGFPAGHDTPNRALYLGREVTVEVDPTGARLLF